MITEKTLAEKPCSGSPQTAPSQCCGTTSRLDEGASALGYPRRNALFHKRIRMMFVFVIASVSLSQMMAADLPPRFDWRNKDGKCFVTPVKAQTGSKDRSSVYAVMDCLESLMLIDANKDYNSMTDAENKNRKDILDLVLSWSEPRLDAGLYAPYPWSSFGWAVQLSVNGGKRVTDFGWNLPAPPDTMPDTVLYFSETLQMMDYFNSKASDDAMAFMIDVVKQKLRKRPFVMGWYPRVSHFNGNYYFTPYGLDEYDEEDLFAVLVVGYDDTIPATSFQTKGVTPQLNGAWIVKGSYGANSYDNGYFYISYADASFFDFRGHYNSAFCPVEMTIDEKGEYRDFYCHCADAPISSASTVHDTAVANMFVAKTNGIVNAIGLFSWYGGTKMYVDGNLTAVPHHVVVSAYVDCEEGKPTSGKQVLDSETVVIDASACEGIGYKTVKLPRSFVIKKDSRFSIIIEASSCRMGVVCSPNPQRGRSFFCYRPWDDLREPDAEWKDFLDDDFRYRNDDDYLNWFLHTGPNGNTLLLTAYTAAKDQQFSIHLEASDGEVDDYVQVVWKPSVADPGMIYDLYRSKDKGYLGSCIGQGLQRTHFEDDTAERDVKYWYKVVTRVKDKNGKIKTVWSNQDDGMYATKPDIIEVKVAPLWLTGEGPYNTQLTWNKFNGDVYKVAQVFVDLVGVEGPADMCFGIKGEVDVNGSKVGLPGAVNLVDLYKWGLYIPKGNSGKHGKYLMNTQWEYVNKKTGRVLYAPKDGDGPSQNVSRHGTEVNVYFHKYNQDCQGGGGALANWFYHWLEDGVIPVAFKHYFSYDKYYHGMPYDNKFHYSSLLIDKYGRTDTFGKGINLPNPAIDKNAIVKMAFTANGHLGQKQILRVTSADCKYELADNAAAIGDVLEVYKNGNLEFVGVRSRGVQKMVDTFAHEYKHGEIFKSLFSPGKYFMRFIADDNPDCQTNYLKIADWIEDPMNSWDSGFRQKVGEIGNENMILDYDGDGISDNDELNGTFGCMTYVMTADSFSLGKNPPGNYRSTGDNEYFARSAEREGPIFPNKNNDWAFPGSKIATIHEGYQNVDLEIKGKDYHQDYRCWNKDKKEVMDMLHGIDGLKDYDNENFWDKKFYDRVGGRPTLIGDTQSGRNKATRQLFLAGCELREDLFDGSIYSSGGLPSSYMGIVDSIDTIANIMSLISVGEGRGCHTNDNGRYAALGFQVALTNMTSDVQDCIVSGNLFDSNCVAVAWAQMRVQMEGNSAAAAELLFDGRYLYESRSGGFVLRDVAVQPISIDVAPYYDVTNANVAVAADCAYSAFTPHDGYVFPETLAETIDEKGISFDVDVEINGDEPLTLSATLLGTNGEYVAVATLTNLMWSGVRRVTLAFPANDIWFSNVDGPYKIGVLQLLKGNEVVWNGVVDHVTAECGLEDLLSEDACVVAQRLWIDAHKVYGDDGKVDSVSFDFDVHNSMGDASYRLRGYLYTTNDTFVCSTTILVDLTNGVNKVSLPFAGEQIITRGEEGPYYVREAILEPVSGEGFRDHVLPRYATIDLKLSDFGGRPFDLVGEPRFVPGANGQPPYVEISLDVKRAGNIEVSMNIWTCQGVYAGTVTAKEMCEVGNSIIRLVLPPLSGSSGGEDEYVMRRIVLKGGYGYDPMSVSYHHGEIVSSTQNMRTITFDANGGVVDEEGREVEDGAEIGPLPTPEWSGFAFDGWWTLADGGIKVTEYMIVTNDMTCYAHWIVDEGGSGDGGDTPHPTAVHFLAAKVEATGGDALRIAVLGGNSNDTVSVGVYLTYSTATAADLDLAKGTVDGSTPKGGLKFPLTLSWAKGEIGEKVITIPIKADKTVEADEFFTLQLADAQGMELGDERVCTVTIHDPGYDELAAKIADGTATKAEKTAWEKLQKAKAPYIRGVADSAERGKVTGSGLCAAGKKVTLKATANKGFVFVGWTDSQIALDGDRLLPNAVKYVATTPSLVIDRSAKPGKNTATSTTITGVDEDATYYACFITSDEDKAAMITSVDGLALDPWVSKTETHALKTNIWAGVYLEWPIATTALSETTVKVAGLPAGLKFAAKPVTSKVGTGKTAVTVTNVQANTIYGAPSAASKTTTDRKTGKVTVTPSEVKVTVTTAGKSSQTYQIDTVVDALPSWAFGTFNGGWEPEGVATSGGQVSLAIDAKGKISGKALGDGLTYTLAAPYYSGFAAIDDGEGVFSNFLADVTTSWSYKEGSKTIKTNDVVLLTVQDNGIGGVAAGVAAREDTRPSEWTAWQYNWKIDPWKVVGKKFDKQTRVYAILSDGTFSESETDLTSALGAHVTARVALKFAASGAVSVAGEFVTGYDEKKHKYTTVKATGSATLVPVDDDHGEVFIYLMPKGLPPHVRCIEVPWPEE